MSDYCFIIIITTYYFIKTIPKKHKLQQIAFNHSSNIDYYDFMRIYKNVHYLIFLVNDTTLSLNHLSFFDGLSDIKTYFIKSITINHDNWWKN